MYTAICLSNGKRYNLGQYESQYDFRYETGLSVDDYEVNGRLIIAKVLPENEKEQASA